MKRATLIMCVLLLITGTAAAQLETVWTRTYGGAANDGLRSAIPTGDGGFVAVGYTYATDDGTQFNTLSAPSLASVPDLDGYLVTVGATTVAVAAGAEEDRLGQLLLQLLHPAHQAQHQRRAGPVHPPATR